MTPLLMKLHMHNHIMVTNFQYQFHEIQLHVWLRAGKGIKTSSIKGNNSSIADDTLVKIQMHNHIMVIYIQYKLHEIPSIGYLVMTEDGKNH